MKSFIKKIISSGILVLIVFQGISIAADKGGPFYSGADPVILGRGGTGVSKTGTAGFLLNPATAAQVERILFTASYGSIAGDYTFPVATLLIPGAYGVLGLGFGYFSGPLDDMDSTGYMFTLGLSKEITSGFMFGLSANGVYWSGDETSFYGGIKPGFIMKFDGTDSYNKFGIFNPALGVSADLGFATGDEASINSATIGYNFDFFKADKFSLGWYNEVSAISGFKAYPVKFGLECEIADSWHVRAGAVVPESYSYMTYTAGAGYTFSGDTFGFSLDYALAYSGQEGISHYAGIKIEYGSLDREAPAIAVTPDYTYISPNYDGVQDHAMFDIDVTDRSRIKGWRLQVTDERDMVVREFKVSEREMEENLTPMLFVQRFFSSKDSLTVPETVMWDGSDASGKKLPDGRYRYHFFAWDERDNIAPVKSGYMVIDTTVPDAVLDADSLIFSPNGDGNKDTLVIKQKIVSTPDDIWTGEIKNSEGVTVVTYEWNGTTIPSKLVWNGKGKDDNLLPDGIYYYSITSSDKAGNSTTAHVKEIILTTVTDVADLRPSAEYFSYRSSKEKSIRFFPDLASVKGMEKWEVTISDKDGDPVRVIGGTGQVSSFVDWDCIDEKGERLDDGDYYASLSVWYNSGNNPVSYKKKIIFDGTAPEVKISHSPEFFSPDADGENDYLTINTGINDNGEIARWETAVYNESGILFKKFTGKGPSPESFNWDGIGDNGETVESASDYNLQFFAVDAAGNISQTANDRFAVDILVIVTERGLKMRISNIEFAFGSAVLKKRGTKILDRVYQILEKYKNYKVVIEGHSDDIGSEETNLALSEKRALAVRDYLVKKGTDTERLKYVGMGESSPFYPNTNEENRRRNRRVEFLLIKDKTE
ncbi:MAG TPA: OmpA family protein [Spirochaetota bacterium]|nr:OmpA family protein [Spirochaetota bacterium]